jgi:TolA-binding protein
VTQLEEQLKTLQKEIASLREQRLNDQLLLQLSGTWHEMDERASTKEGIPAMKPNLWD